MEVCSKVEECQRNFSLSIAKVHCKPSLQNHYTAADIQTPNHPLKIHGLSLTLCCFILKYAFLTMQSENNKFKHILILWPWIMKAVTLHQIIHSIILEMKKYIINNTNMHVLFYIWNIQLYMTQFTDQIVIPSTITTFSLWCNLKKGTQSLHWPLLVFEVSI